MATIKDIAGLAGVSRGTVDRVLNNRGSVKPETAKKIEDIAKALNYTPNLAGKTLAAKKKHLKFGFILFKGTNNSFFNEVMLGIEDRIKSLKEFGATVEVRFSTIDDPETQVKLIDELLAENINGLVITPISHPLVIEKLKKLTSSGFPVVTTNSDIPNCGRLAYVGSNYYKSGETAAGLMNLMGGNSAVNVGIILGSPLVLCHSERVAGFTNQVKKEYPHIKIIDTAINNDDDIESFSVTKQMLLNNPNINALYLAAAGVMGACRAVEDSGLKGKIKIVSYDAIPETIKLIEEGAILATIAQEPFTQGAKPLDILLEYTGLGVQPEKEYFYTKIEIRIKQNIHGV